MSQAHNQESLATLASELLNAQAMLSGLPESAQRADFQSSFDQFYRAIETASDEFIRAIQQGLTPDEQAIKKMLSEQGGLEKLNDIMQTLMPSGDTAPKAVVQDTIAEQLQAAVSTDIAQTSTEHDTAVAIAQASEPVAAAAPALDWTQQSPPAEQASADIAHAAPEQSNDANLSMAASALSPQWDPTQQTAQ